jgi:hypothetical protein
MARVNIPQLLEKVTTAKDAGASVTQVLAALTRTLLALRSDDRETILRRIFRLFGTARDKRALFFVTFGIFPRPIRPHGRKPRKAKRVIVRDLGRRRHCGYGVDAYTRNGETTG